METDYYCWNCNSVLEQLILPMSRREECRQCSNDQHVCRMCKHFESDSTKQCSEERAEPPSNKESANFCDYFDPQRGSSGTKGGGSSESEQALNALNDLFGD